MRKRRLTIRCNLIRIGRNPNYQAKVGIRHKEQQGRAANDEKAVNVQKYT